MEPNLQPRLTWLLAAILTLSLGACALDMAGAVDSTRTELKKQLREIDADGQQAMKRSWYGRLIQALYEPAEHNNVRLRDRLDSSQISTLRKLLQDVADDVQHAAKRQMDDAGTYSALHLPSIGDDLSVTVLPADHVEVIVRPDCRQQRIEFSIEAIRKIVATALAQQEVNEWENLAHGFFFSMLHIPASERDMAYQGPAAAFLFGPPQNKLITKKLEHTLGAQGTVVWKALAFIIGHEAHHLWSQQCERAVDDAAQQKAEARADVLGTILAIEAYNRTCGRELLASSEDVQVMLDPKKKPPDPPLEARLQMERTPSPDLLVGASGFQAMQHALGALMSSDPSHPLPADRQSMEERGTRSLVSKLFGQPLKKSWALGLVSRIADVPKQDLIEGYYSDLVFSPNYRIQTSLICTDILFQERQRTAAF